MGQTGLRRGPGRHKHKVGSNQSEPEQFLNHDSKIDYILCLNAKSSQLSAARHFMCGHDRKENIETLHSKIPHN